MANEKNLKPINKRTKSEQREIQSKGGKKSGQVRRKKKLLKEHMKDLLEMPVSGSGLQFLEDAGFPSDGEDNKFALITALYLKGLSGDVAAFKEIKELIGEQKTEETGMIEKLIEGLKDD